MAATTLGDQLILTGDNLGWSGGTRQILRPPGSWDGMIVAFRAWWDAYTNVNQDMTTPGWDTIACLGLGFTDTFPTFGGADGFFGIRGNTGPTGNMGSFWAGDSFGSGKQGAWIWGSSTTHGLYNSASAVVTNFNNGTGGIRHVPANPSVGAEFTGVWVIKRGTGANDLQVSAGYNMESLSHANLVVAAESPQTVWIRTNTALTDGVHWRANGNMNFPQWFLLKNPSPTIGRKLVLDHAAFRFFKFDVF